MTVRGIVVGKFWPPHQGHQYLIETALNNCDQLYILVVQRDFEQPSGQQRASWLQKWYPQAIVRLTDDDIGDGPENYHETHGLWAEKTRKLLGFYPDMVFSSESYGPGWAKAMGCQHVLVDAARRRFSVSGSAVRENPFAVWDKLHPDVRAYYTKRVVIVGAESCGKTTLARNLAKRFGTVWVPEWARIYGEAMYYGPHDWEQDDQLFNLIVENQPVLENQLAQQAGPVLICDTDLLTTSIWYETYRPGEPPDWIRAAHNSHVQDRGYVLYLHALPDVPWVQDGGRNRGSEGAERGSRSWFRDRFRSELPATGVPVVELSGDWRTREEMAIKAIENLF